jgi:hypothetical protein
MGRRHRIAMLNTWGERTTWDEVCRRARGRRQYHSLRRFKALAPAAGQPTAPACGLRLRRQGPRTLGVFNATMTRDVRASFLPCL